MFEVISEEVTRVLSSCPREPMDPAVMSYLDTLLYFKWHITIKEAWNVQTRLEGE